MKWQPLKKPGYVLNLDFRVSVFWTFSVHCLKNSGLIKGINEAILDGKMICRSI